MLKIMYNIILIMWNIIIFVPVLTKKQQIMSNFNRFNCLLFVPLDDEKRVSIRLLKSGAATRLTTIFQLRRFFLRVFKFRFPRGLYLQKSDMFIIHDNVAECFYLCHFIVDMGVIVVESSLSSSYIKLDIDDLLERYLYYSRFDANFLNWDELLQYLHERYYTGRFNEDFFIRLNAPAIVFHKENLSI